MAGWKHQCCSQVCPNLGQNFSILVPYKSCQKSKTIGATNELDLTASPDKIFQRIFPWRQRQGARKEPYVKFQYWL